MGCSRPYTRAPELDKDYGVPHGICRETSPGSGVFERDWSKAKVKMDCPKAPSHKFDVQIAADICVYTNEAVVLETV